MNEQLEEAEKINADLLHERLDIRARGKMKHKVYMDKYHKPDPDKELFERFCNVYDNNKSGLVLLTFFKELKSLNILTTEEHDNKLINDTLDRVKEIARQHKFVPGHLVLSKDNLKALRKPTGAYAQPKNKKKIHTAP